MKMESKQIEMLDVFIKLKDAFSHLSKSQKKIAMYILTNYEKAPHMAAVEMAKAVGVSEATVIRFANNLGFEGYPEFRKKLQEDVNSKLTTLERIELSVKDDQLHPSGNKYVRKVLKKDCHSIIGTMETLENPVFEESVKRIAGAKKVVVVGFRTTSMLTEYLGYYLNLILDDVRVINHSSTDFYEQLIKFGEDDVVIAVSFPRYTQMTIEAVDFLKQRGSTIIAITDNEDAPLVKFADYALFAKTTVYSFVDSLVAPMSLINALVIAVGAQNLDTTKAKFSELESIWKEREIYTGDQVTEI